MISPNVRVLRITGLPHEMASRAIDAVLGSDRGVLAIDAIDPGPEDACHHAVHVLAEEAGVERIRRKVATGFMFVDIEDVTDSSAAARTPSQRIRAASIQSLPPLVTLETRELGSAVSMRLARGMRSRGAERPV